MEEIEVRVVVFGDRKYLQMQYRDTVTGKKKTRSTRTTDRRKAERAAAKWEAELREGRYKAASKITWAEFRERYEDEKLPAQADKTARMHHTVANWVERILDPRRLRDLNSDRLSFFQSQLRAATRKVHGSTKHLSEATIRAYLRHLKAMLNWAVAIGILNEAPKIILPKRARNSRFMKGRPITAEEHDRMLAKLESALFDRVQTPNAKMKMSAPQLTDSVKQRVLDSWRRLLTGLWLSGLRLGEALELAWDVEGHMQVDFSGKRPVFLIPAESEKGFKDRLLPMTPDFAQFLESTNADTRTGLVFPVFGIRGTRCRSVDWASRIITRIGTAARVKVLSEGGKTKFASAHDLRRSFGHRWARKVMPAVLKELMRHDDISTTMKYYASQNAEDVADVLWGLDEPAGNRIGNSHQNDAWTYQRQKP